MEVITAKTCGFCFGVKRAVDTVYEEAQKGGEIYTYGDIVNNEQVVDDLKAKGVQVLQTEEELEKISSGTVILRAHGVPRRITEMLSEKSVKVIDATCPFVKRIHKIVEEAGEKGRHVVVVGNPVHPEVVGIVGWCKGPVNVIETPEEAQSFVPVQGMDVCLVSQTTFNYKKFQYIVEIFEQKVYNVIVANTICNATEERQREAQQIASFVDAMVVIGGKHSSNTRKLYEICSKECARTYFIQTLDDLHIELPESIRRVGITAGASTPNTIIKEVQNYVRHDF